ncbi:MAG: hypothetical protein DMG60_18165, partial [Acidobacteria bacterium]
LFVVLVNELRQAQRTSHASRSTADDDDIGFHLGAINVGKRGSKNHFRKGVSSFEFQVSAKPVADILVIACII